MDILGLEKLNKEISELKQEVIRMKIKEATFEERFQRLLDKENTYEDRFQRLLDKEEQTGKRIDQLTASSITWRNAAILSLVTVLVQLLLIPLEKYYHLFGL